MKHLNKQSQNFLTVDTQKTALTIHTGSEGGFSDSQSGGLVFARGF